MFVIFGFFSILTSILPIIVIIVIINVAKNAKKKGFYDEDKSTIFKSECDDSCIEEGDDPMSQMREENIKAARERRKSKNSTNRNPKKRYCKHCGAELLYEGETHCDWCGKDN